MSIVQVFSRFCELLPGFVVERQIQIAWSLVNDRVPDRVQVGNTVALAIIGDLLEVTTSVTLRESVIDLGNGMQRLVNISKIVDNETKRE